MNPDADVEKEVAPKEVKSIGFGPKYLDWWMGHEKPPSYKNLADNLRAWLTIGAYVVLLKYLWLWGDDRIPGWVFQGAAIIWGIWVFWFFILTSIQAFHLHIGLCLEFMGLFLEPYAKSRKTTGDITKREWIILELIFLPFACSGIILLGTVFYLIGAMLRGAKMM